MSDAEFRAHLTERWRAVNWLAMWRLIGTFYMLHEAAT